MQSYHPSYTYEELADLNVALQDWQWPGRLDTEALQDRETYGYAKSLAFVQSLVDTAGLDVLQEIARSYDSDKMDLENESISRADSRNYLDALENNGVSATELWRT